MTDTQAKIQKAAHDVSHALSDVLSYVHVSDPKSNKLVELAAAVAHATSELVSNVKVGIWFQTLKKCDLFADDVRLRNNRYTIYVNEKVFNYKPHIKN